MGTKSSNTIKSKEMLPLFRVISDLERPTTPVNDSLTLSDNGSKKRIEVSLSDLSMFKEYSDTDISSNNLNVLNCEECKIERGDHKKRSKKRRRLKENIRNYRYKENRNIYESVNQKSRTNNHIVFPEIHSKAISDDEKYHYNIEKRKTGMFTTMAINMYRDDSVDMSRHFKDINSVDDGIVNLEQSECPIYEDPNEIVVHKKNNSKRKKKKLSKKNIKRTNKSDDITDESCGKSSDRYKRRVSKKSIIKKYEQMFGTLLEKCKIKDAELKEKDHYLIKIKKKLKELLNYNNQFADENEYLARQHDDMKICIEQHKNYIATLEDHQCKVEQKSNIGAVNQSSCSRCNVLEVSAINIERENMKLNEDVVMLKNVVFRLNVQLSRYQEKLRIVSQSIKFNRECKQMSNTIRNDMQKTESETEINIESQHVQENKENSSIPSLPVFLPSTKASELSDYHKRDTDSVKKLTKVNSIHESDCVSPKDAKNSLQQNTNDTYVIEYEGSCAWGDVNTHTLAPLLNAYQESLTEKDDLIRDYEKEFNRFTSKLKQVINENNNLHSNSSKIASELITLREKCGMAVTERDELRKENSLFKEKIDEFEKKIKNIHECYEQKVESMSRDYTTIHQEYFKTKTGLAAAQGRCQVLEDHHKSLETENMIPSKIHILKIEECKRLFEELKIRYEMEKGKSSTRLNMLEENNIALEKKYIIASNEKHNLETKYKYNEKLLKKCRHTLLSYRKELTAVKASRDVFKRRASRATNLCRQLAVTLEHAAGDERFHHLKAETLNVQKEALKELDALEERMKEQDFTLNKLREDNISEITKLEDTIQEKDATIEAMKRHMRGERLKRFNNQTIAEIPAEVLDFKKGLISGNRSASMKNIPLKFLSAPSHLTQHEYFSSKDIE